MRPRTSKLAPACVKLFWANLFQVEISKHPPKLLPVVLNTSCSTLNADRDIGIRCMSGNLFARDAELRGATTTFIGNGPGIFPQKRIQEVSNALVGKMMMLHSPQVNACSRTSRMCRIVAL